MVRTAFTWNGFADDVGAPIKMTPSDSNARIADGRRLLNCPGCRSLNMAHLTCSLCISFSLSGGASQSASRCASLRRCFVDSRSRSAAEVAMSPLASIDQKQSEHSTSRTSPSVQVRQRQIRQETARSRPQISCRICERNHVRRSASSTVSKPKTERGCGPHPMLGKLSDGREINRICPGFGTRTSRFLYYSVDRPGPEHLHLGQFGTGQANEGSVRRREPPGLAARGPSDAPLDPSSRRRLR